MNRGEGIGIGESAGLQISGGRFIPNHLPANKCAAGKGAKTPGDWSIRCGDSRFNSPPLYFSQDYVTTPSNTLWRLTKSLRAAMTEKQSILLEVPSINADRLQALRDLFPRSLQRKAGRF